MPQLDTNALFVQYLNVVNKALGEHKHDFPYDLLFKGAKKALGDKNVGVSVYATDPDSPHDYFTIGLTDHGTFEVVDHGKAAGPERPKIAWKVPEEHMRRVVHDPQPYIDRPARLDLDWLKSRLRGQG